MSEQQLPDPSQYGQQRMTRAQRQWAPGQVQPPRSVKVLFASTVLCLQAVLMFFFGLAAWGLNQHEWYAWWLFGGSLVLAAACVFTCPLLQRPAGYAVGWVLQGLMLAGFVGGALLSGDGMTVALAILPGIGFVVCWWYAVTTGERIDAEKMERYRLEEQLAADSQKNDDVADSEETKDE